MRILQVIESFSPQFGGPVKSVYNISRELSKRGHEVTIATTDIEYDDNYIKSIEKYGVQVISFKYDFNFAFFLYSPSMKSWLDSEIKNFDIIHMHNFRTYQNYIVSKYAKKNGVPYILQARGSVLPFFKNKLLKRFMIFLSDLKF